MGLDAIFAGINLTLLLMVVSGTEIVKTTIPLENRKWYILVSFLISIILTFLNDGFEGWRIFTFSSVANFLLAKIFYDTILQWIETKKADLHKKLEE